MSSKVLLGRAPYANSQLNVQCIHMVATLIPIVANVICGPVCAAGTDRAAVYSDHLTESGPDVRPFLDCLQWDRIDYFQVQRGNQADWCQPVTIQCWSTTRAAEPCSQ